MRVTEQRTTINFAEELRILVEETYPAPDRIVLVTAKLNTYTLACLNVSFAPEQARNIAALMIWRR